MLVPTGDVSNKDREKLRQLELKMQKDLWSHSGRSTARTCGQTPGRHLLPPCQWPHSPHRCPPASSLHLWGCPGCSSRWTVHPSASPACTSRRFQLQLWPEGKHKVSNGPDHVIGGVHPTNLDSSQSAAQGTPPAQALALIPTLTAPHWPLHVP